MITSLRSKFAVVVCLSLLITAVGSCQSGEKEELSEPAKRDALKNKIQSDLAGRHGAVADWEKRLEVTPYSVDVEGELVRPASQPIFFFAYVEDVARNGDKYLISLNYSGPSVTRFQFLLECKPELANQIVNQSDRIFVEVGIVASIVSVTKPTIQLEGRSVDGEADEVEIEPTMSQMFIAKGTCIDLALVK